MARQQGQAQGQDNQGQGQAEEPQAFGAHRPGSNQTLPPGEFQAEELRGTPGQGQAPGATDEHGRWIADGPATEPYAITLYPRQIQGYENIRPDISRANDWRNADVVLRLDGLRVRTNDRAFEAHAGAVEPDWSQGTYLMDNATGRTIDLGDNPADIFRRALLEGRVLYGVIVARDEQFHN